MIEFLRPLIIFTLLAQHLGQMAQIDHHPLIVQTLTGHQIGPDLKQVQCIIPGGQKAFLKPHFPNDIQIRNIATEAFTLALQINQFFQIEAQQTG